MRGHQENHLLRHLLFGEMLKEEIGGRKKSNERKNKKNETKRNETRYKERGAHRGLLIWRMSLVDSFTGNGGWTTGHRSGAPRAEAAKGPPPVRHFA